MRKKRDKKEQKIAQKKHYDGLEAKTDEKALADFRKPAYQAGSMVQAQGRQLEHRTLIEYLAERRDIKANLEGETDGANDKRKTGRL